MDAMKQVIVARMDLKLSPGKLAAQVAHASLDAYKKAGKEAREEWESEGAKKVVLKIAGLDKLEETFRLAKAEKLPVSKITDAGHTEIAPGTVTCVGIGPAEDARIDKVTGALKML
jgi:PTH2 family peptidyl-tRNA hydrolase